MLLLWLFHKNPGYNMYIERKHSKKYLFRNCGSFVCTVHHTAAYGKAHWEQQAVHGTVHKASSPCQHCCLGVRSHTAPLAVTESFRGGRGAIFHLLLFLCEMFALWVVFKEPWKVLSRAIEHSKEYARPGWNFRWVFLLKAAWGFWGDVSGVFHENLSEWVEWLRTANKPMKHS